MRPLKQTLALAVLAVGVGACVPKEQYDSTLTELASARKANEDVEAALAQCQEELEQIRNTSAADAAAAKAATERRLAAYRQLQALFKELIDAGNLEVYMRRGWMIVGLPSAVLFPSGSADLSRKGEKTLAKVAKIFKGMPKRRVQVAGHTDSTPIGEKLDFADNWELSTTRALTVTRFMVANGVKPANLGAAGYGEFDPVADNGKRSGRRRNRRIELVLVPDLSELPELSKELEPDPAAQ